jgi:hypothetical protein
MSDRGPVDRLRELWSAGEPPDLEAFVVAAGPLDTRELAAVLRADQAARWAAGMPVPAEDYLSRFPAAAADAEAAVDLIHNEYLLSERHATAPDPEAFVDRFPAHAETLRLQIDLHRGLAAPSTATDRPTRTGPAAAAMLPERFGRYKVLSQLGCGGMGTVYAAYDTQLDRNVALKVPAFQPGDSAGAERFLREAQIAAGLTHPNLCPVYDVGEVDSVQYLTMPVIDGDSLAVRLRRDGRLTPPEAISLVTAVARAVAVAHAAGVVHRDLKPANILLDGRGNPVVTDFGLARRGTLDELRLTASGVFVGTPTYAAPEQIAATEAATPAADVYALGAVLYECLTGRPPFGGRPEDMLKEKLTGEPSPPSRRVPEISPALDAACLKALANSRDRRFASMDAFAAALETCGPGTPPKGRRRWAVGAALLGLGIVLLALLAWRSGCLRPGTSEGPPAAAVSELELLPLGSRWTGTHSFDPEDADSWHPAELRVTSRDGDRFAGEASTFNGQFAWGVEGTIRGKVIAWKYVRIVREEQPTGSVENGAFAEGELSDGRMEVRYVDPGDQVRGIIRLTRVE